jgi:hypothetical protein
VGDFARTLIDLLQKDDTTLFPAVFDEVERLIVGTPATRYFAIVGFVEGLQNSSLWASLPLKRWHPWLRPNTRHAWSAVEGLWSATLPAAAFNEYVRTGDPSALQLSLAVMARARARSVILRVERLVRRTRIGHWS